MKKEALENINSDLFNSFNLQEELWIVGGTGSVTSIVTGDLVTWKDGGTDGDFDFEE